MDIEGNIVTKEEENAEVLNVFCVSVSNSKPSCSLDTQPSEMEDRGTEEKEALITQGEMVR